MRYFVRLCRGGDQLAMLYITTHRHTRDTVHDARVHAQEQQPPRAPQQAHASLMPSVAAGVHD